MTEATTAKKLSADTRLIHDFLDAWHGDDRQRLVGAKRALLADGASADALMVAACHDVAERHWLEAGRRLQAALDRRCQEWAEYGWMGFRPDILPRTQQTHHVLNELLKQERDSPGIRWLAVLWLAHSAKKDKALRAVDTLRHAPVPKWFRCHLRWLAEALDRRQFPQPPPPLPPAHQQRTAHLMCPLATADGDGCRCADAAEGHGTPFQQTFCGSPAWSACPCFVRTRREGSTSGQGPVASRQALAEVDRAFDAGHFDKAVQLTRQALQKDPLSDQLYFMAALALRNQKQSAEAYLMLSVAAVLKPDEPTIFATLSALAMELGDPQLGELHAQAALRLNPKHAVAMNNLAEAVKLQGRRSEAAGHHRHACELDPNNASWLRAWVLSLAWLGQFAEAEQHAARLVTLPQHTKEDQEMLAQVRENRAADEALAKQANRRCATLGPPAQALRRLSGDGAIAGYARDLLLANREQECQTVIQHLERSPAGKAAGEIVRGAQLYLRRQGVSELREAVQHFDRGLPSFLADADVARHFGLIVTRTFFCLGEHEKALEWAQRFLAVDASNPYLVSMIAQLMRLLGRPQPEIDQAVSSYKWRFMLRQAPLAIAASALPLSLLACMPMPVWLQAILSMICAAGSSGLTMWQFRDRVPKPYREDFGVVVAGGSVLLVVLTVLITAHGIFGRIVAVIWYGLLALIPGGALMESGEAPEKKG